MSKLSNITALQAQCKVAPLPPPRVDSVTGHAGRIHFCTCGDGYRIRAGRPCPADFSDYVRDVVRSHSGAPSFNCNSVELIALTVECM